MSVLATLVSTPTFTVLELSGVAACHLVLAVLIGLAFRNHLDDLRSAWEFTVCAAVWWLWIIGPIALSGLAWTLPGLPYDIWLDWEETLYRLMGIAGPLLTGMLYVWTFQRRHVDNLPRLLWTLTFTGTVWGLWIGIRNLPVDWLAFYVHREDGWWYWYLAAYDLNHVALPSWQSAVGWVVWYVGLFGGSRTSPRSHEFFTESAARSG